MMRPLINRTYTASGWTLTAYPYRGELAVRENWRSGVDHGSRMLTLVIGAGTPTGPTRKTDVEAAGQQGAPFMRKGVIASVHRSSSARAQRYSCGAGTKELEGVRQHAGQRARSPRLTRNDRRHDERLYDDGLR
jgi:hypothetical protein